MRKTLKSTIAQDAFWSVNKKIALHTSLEAAVILAELVDKESFFENSLIFYEGDYYFYATSDNIKERTTIGYKSQKKAIELLKKADFIKTKLMSTPAKIHFAIMTENVLNFLANEENKFCPNGKTETQFYPNGKTEIYPNGKTCSDQTVKQDSPERQNIIERIDKEELNKKENNFFSSTSAEVRLDEEVFSKKNEGTQDTPHQSLNHNTPNEKETATKNLVDNEYQAPTTIEKLVVLLEAKGCNGQSKDYAREFFYHWQAKEWIVNANGARMKNVDSYLNKFLKSKAPKEKAHPAFVPIRNYFFEYYQETYQRSYKGFNAGDGEALNQIIAKLEKEMIEKQRKQGNIITEIATEETVKVFQFILTSHHLDWVKENLSPRVINSKFNDILNSIRNGKSTSNSNQRSNRGPKSTQEIANDTVEHVRAKYEGTEHAF